MKDFSFIYRLADRFHSNRVLRFLFLKPYRKYKYHVSLYKKKAFHDCAHTVLTLFYEALKEIDCLCWLEFGTLIGAVRENGFIAHDDDIDVGMFLKDRPKNLEKHLAKYGFKRSRHIMVDDGQEAFEETYTLQGISIDIFYFHLSEYANKMHCYEFVTDPDRLPREFMDEVGGFWTMKDTFPYQGFSNHSFLGLTVKIPSNYDEHLKAHYGNYMEPDSDWDSFFKAQNTALMKDKIGTLIWK